MNTTLEEAQTTDIAMQRCGVWFTKDQYEYLRQLAHENRTSISELTRGLVQAEMDFRKGVEEEFKNEINESK